MFNLWASLIKMGMSLDPSFLGAIAMSAQFNNQTWSRSSSYQFQRIRPCSFQQEEFLTKCQRWGKIVPQPIRRDAEPEHHLARPHWSDVSYRIWFESSASYWCKIRLWRWSLFFWADLPCVWHIYHFEKALLPGDIIAFFPHNYPTRPSAPLAHKALRRYNMSLQLPDQCISSYKHFALHIK